MTGERRPRTALLAALAACCVAFPATAAATPGWVAANVPLTGLNPAAGGAPHEGLQAVSCPQSGSCVAVGAYTDTGGSRQGLIETLSQGKLTASTAPLTGLSPAAASNPQIALLGLSCPVAGWCVADGVYQDDAGAQDRLALTLAGGAWTATTLPVQSLNPAASPSDGFGVQKVTCTARQACIAVGAYVPTSGPSPQGLIERLSGTRWTATTAPLTGVGGTFDALNDVSCSSSSSCVAVGSTDGSGGDLIETLAGGAWQASSPSLAGLKPPPIINPFTHQPSGGSLSNVSCPSTGGCSEVGTYEDNTSATQGLIVRGGKTTAVDVTKIKPPAFSNPFFAFSGLACTTAACNGLGDYTSTAPGGSTGRINSLTKLTSGTASTTALPLTGLNPASSSPPGGALESFSCPSAVNCVGVGQYVDSHGNPRGIVETISSASTATTPLLTALQPAPAANPDSTLLAVSCPPSGPCLAIGNYIDASEVLHEIVASPAATTVTRVGPGAGPIAGGQTVTITGTGFVAGAKVAFGAGALSPSVTFVSSHELKAVSPAHAAGTINVQVITSGGTSPATAADAYTYGPPAVTGVSPASGPAAGGQTVTIAGTGFVAGAKVAFGAGALSPSVTVVSSHQLRAVSPAHAAGTINVQVITSGGTSPANAADHYTYSAA